MFSLVTAVTWRKVRSEACCSATKVVYSATPEEMSSPTPKLAPSSTRSL